MESILAHARNTRNLERKISLARERSPVLPQKSPTFHQKSPIFHQQIPPILQKYEKSIDLYARKTTSRARNITCTRAQSCIKRGLFCIKRAVFCIKRALCCLKRALYFINKALYFIKRALYFFKRALCTRPTRNLKPRVFPPFSNTGCKQRLLVHTHPNTRAHTLSHLFTWMRDSNDTFPLFGLGRIFFKFGKHLWGEFVSVTQKKKAANQHFQIEELPARCI